MNRAWPSLATILAAALTIACNAPEKPAPAPASASPAAPAPASAPARAHDGAHSDHDPKQGGILYMSGNMYHHFEGTYLEPGVFRLHVYDDHTKPIDAQATTGTIRVEAGSGAEIPLAFDAATNSLVGRIEPPPSLPAVVLLTVNLTNPRTGEVTQEKHRFPFAAVGPVAMAGIADSHGAGDAHSHGAGDAHSHGAGDAHSHGVGDAHSHAPAEDHAHGSPHGGKVMSAGAEHHLELVTSGDTIVLWVLDGAEKALPVDGMSATLLMQPAGGTPITLPLPPMGNVHFMAKNPLGAGQAAVAVATVTIAGRARTARFEIPAR